MPLATRARLDYRRVEGSDCHGAPGRDSSPPFRAAATTIRTWNGERGGGRTYDCWDEIAGCGNPERA